MKVKRSDTRSRSFKLSRNFGSKNNTQDISTPATPGVFDYYSVHPREGRPKLNNMNHIERYSSEDEEGSPLTGQNNFKNEKKKNCKLKNSNILTQLNNNYYF